jgi:flagellar biosynthesis protein FlhB
MAEDSDLERTEAASPRRLEEARAKGNVPRSRELNTFAIMMAGGVTLLILGPKFANGLTALMQHWFTFNYATLRDPMMMWRGLWESTLAMIILFAPLMLVLIIAAFAAPLSIGGLNPILAASIHSKVLPV